MEASPKTCLGIELGQGSALWMAEERYEWERWTLVELSGIEPLTSSLRTTRSPN